MPVLMRGGGGGKKIKDATAVPSDVANGKIFYNNDGRQIGSGESFKSVTLALTGTGKVDLSKKIVNARYFTYNKNVCLGEISMGERFIGGKPTAKLPPFFALIAVKINGMYFPLPSSMHDLKRNIVMRSYMNQTDNLDFYILEDGSVGLINANNQKITMTVYYI